MKPNAQTQNDTTQENMAELFKSTGTWWTGTVQEFVDQYNDNNIIMLL